MKLFYSILQIALAVLTVGDVITLFGSLFIYWQNPDGSIVGVFAGSFILFFTLILLFDFVSEKKIKS